ncbi:MAG TPA: pitrilysin family protein [Syntrophorhabdaceae bacterium]|jgi:predicted Zn-dependent peptidase|nr:insulinase family protein [Syntrophorhabdaceae bacterium]HOF56967.1 pitrilysin family protein [Syntrophorhabdaceae bacterium]HOS04518.1 pitrilysin family protein [Syntrophorhabdaceae bacterium]HPL40133.1 pitrilysin family protein [Syntrophorhabdaceae bacterium]HQM76880.1 pitrilysin family protein [Syntrophorhabdaceae bacterium]
MYNKTVLDNGITVVTESISYFSTVSLGLWWKTGGRYENLSNNGISHFIEHMLFKGTKKRSAFDIAKEIDAVGGVINAFTGKEYTCFYARVLRKDMDIALDVLSDMSRNSLFDEDEIEKEKYVITQEIKMIEDNPEEYIYDMFNASYYKNHPLGMTILGKEEVIDGFNKDMLTDHYYRNHSPDSLIITATGRIDHNNFVNKIDRLFGDLKNNGSKKSVSTMPVPHKSIDVFERDLEHIYLCLGTEGASQVDSKRYCLYALNAIIGGSMSSHLFQEIREKRGLVYNIYSYVNCYHDNGTFGISTSTSEEFIGEVLGLVKEEIERIRNHGISDVEIAFSKEHIKGNLFISLESSEARMGRLAKNEIYFADYVPLRETLREIDNIKKSDVDEMAKKIFRNPCDISLTILGKADKEQILSIWKD